MLPENTGYNSVDREAVLEMSVVSWLRASAQAVMPTSTSTQVCI